MRQAPVTRPARLGVECLEDRTTPAALPPGFTETPVAGGMTSATAFELGPQQEVWALDQTGRVNRYPTGSTTADVVADLSVLGLRSEGERGLLGIAFDPNYAANKFVYLYYTSSDAPNPHNRVSRFTVNDANPFDYSLIDTPENPAPLDEAVILDLDPQSSAVHNGGAIHFGPDGKLYVAVGDSGVGANAQSLSNRHGKILRINADGSIPADNPSIAGLGTPSGANRAIWAAGLRNPFTFTFQPGTGVMHVNDVGQNTREEVNVGGAGRNYGWPNTEGDFNPSSNPNFTRPLYSYPHGGGTFEGFAVTGGAFYNPETVQFPPEYTGDYFFADVASSWIHVMNADGSDVRVFATDAPGALDLRVAPDGSLYYLARNRGQVYRVTYTGGLGPVITQSPTTILASTDGTATFTVAASGAQPLAYRWQFRPTGGDWADLADRTGVTGAATPTLTLTTGGLAAGLYRAVVSNSAGSARSAPATLVLTTDRSPVVAVSITGGLTDGKFIAGKPVTFAATAVDPETGTISPAALTWKVEFLSTLASGNPVVRPFVQPFTGQYGGVFTPATTGPYTQTDVAYRVTVTARDPLGLTTTRTVEVFPNVADLVIRTQPAGLAVTVDGQPAVDGVVVPSVVGFQRVIGVTSKQRPGGYKYTFRSWSDGGAVVHAVAAPLAGGTYTARYVFEAKINFQPAAAAVPAGWLPDAGAVFGDRGKGFSYGWTVDNAAAARDRNAPNSPDQRFDTFLTTQQPGNPDAAWELAVPNGTYRVRVVAGDPARPKGPYGFDVEGVRAIDGTPGTWFPWLDMTVTVTVADGRLTLANAPGAMKNRINFVVVKAV